MTLTDSTKISVTFTYYYIGTIYLKAVTTYTNSTTATAYRTIGSVYSYNWNSSLKKLIAYNGDGSYNTYTFTISGTSYSYSKVATTSSGTSTTTTGTFTPTFTYNTDNTASSITITLDDSSKVI
jgi:hypothetical protein